MTKDAKQMFRLIGTTGAVYLIFRYLLPLVVPFIFAVLMAKLLAPMIRWCYKKLRLPEKLVAFLLLGIIVAGLALFFGTIVVACGKQLTLLVRNFPRYQNLWYTTIEDICCHMDGMLGLVDGVSMGFVQTNFSMAQAMLSQNLTPKITIYAKDMIFMFGKLAWGVFIFFISTIMILNERDSMRKGLTGCFWYRKMEPFFKKWKGTGFAYLKAQGIIIFIVSCVCVLGLILIGNPYAVLFGIAIGIIDAFPVVGSGSILVPWGIFHILSGNIVDAAILVTVYVITLIIREVLEPRLLGNCLGVSPLYMLMAIFVGIKLFGVAGIVLGPVGLITIRHLYEQDWRIKEC